jgi:hypothetical protein
MYSLSQGRRQATSTPSPWRVHVLTGEPKRALGEAMLAAHVAATVPSFTPFLEAMPAETAARVGEFGRRLYSAMGVDRADAIALSARQRPQLRVLRRARRADLHHRRRAHQPPAGSIAGCSCKASCWPHLSTCPQVWFVRFQALIAERLGLRSGEL